MGREFALRQAEDHIGILKEAAAMLKAENAALKDEIRRHEEVFQFSANKIAALKRENGRLRGFLDTIMLNWEKHRVYKALLTAEEQE